MKKAKKALFDLGRAAALLGVVVAIGCTSHASSPRPEQARIDSKSVPGLSLELREIVDGSSIPHPPDDAWPDHVQEVDTRSTLRLTFQGPRAAATSGASPEWTRVDRVTEQLGALMSEYAAFARAAMPSPRRSGAEADEHAAALARFAERQRDLLAALSSSSDGTALLTREEAEAVASAEGGPFVGLANWIEQEITDVAARARTSRTLRSDVLVTVRARVEPRAGLEQWLQVPGYWEKSGELPENNVTRIVSTGMERVSAESEAAQRIAAAIRRLQQQGDAIARELGGALEAARDRTLARWLEFVAPRAKLLDEIRALRPAAAAAATREEVGFFQQVDELASLLSGSLADLRRVSEAARARAIRDQFDDLRRTLEELDRRRATIDSAAAALLASLPARIAAASGDAKPPLEALRKDLAANWKGDLAALSGELSRARESLAAASPLFDSGSQLLAGVQSLPGGVDGAIPRPSAELPPVELDLPRQPINPADRLRLEIAFFDQAEYANAEAHGRTAQPLETIRFTNDAMKSGWLWSGDLIFTQQINGTNHDFSSTAAVSYEHHWRDRDEPRGFANLLDPGIGFHAAALNFDPDVTAEFGAGVNASILGGLIRVGAGYDLSISRDREYWFVGFGMITTLETMKSVGSKAFGELIAAAAPPIATKEQPMSARSPSRRDFLKASAAAAAALSFRSTAVGRSLQEASAPVPASLEKRRLGKTGMEVAILGFGGAEIGYEKTDQATVSKLLNAALDAGLNVVDTAECYIDSEVQIAAAIGSRRKEFFLFTKCGHATETPGQSADWSKAGLLRSIERSLKRLKTDAVDLVQLHSCSIDELKKGECIEALEQAKDDGLTRFIGYSGDGDAALFAVESGRFDTLQTSINLCDQQSIELTLPVAKAKDMGVIAKRPIANAVWRYEKQPDNGYHLEYWKRLQALKYDFAMGEAREKQGPDGPAAIAMRFTAMQPGVHVLIVGTTKPERWKQNADLMKAGPLPKELAESIRARWRAANQSGWVGQT